MTSLWLITEPTCLLLKLKQFSIYPSREGREPVNALISHPFPSHLHETEMVLVVLLQKEATLVPVLQGKS